MIRLTVIALVLVCVMPPASAVEWSFSNAQARYRLSHHHRHHDHPRVSDPIDEPIRPSVDPNRAEVSAEVWPAFTGMHFKYPYITGTSVLDRYSGRKPVISAFTCGYQVNDLLRWRRDWGYMDVK